jgi:flagellar capping protein FliD
MSNKDILNLILNKLDNVDKRLDNVDKRLDNVDKRLDNIEKKFDKKINNIELKLNELIKYRIINDKIIEKQLTKDVQNYLIDTYKCCVVINISDKIPKKLFNSDGKILTEFDGVFIVSNDISLLSKFDKSFINKYHNIKKKILLINLL